MNTAEICRERGWGPGTVLVWAWWYSLVPVRRALITQVEARWVHTYDEHNGTTSLLAPADAAAARILGRVSQRKGGTWPRPKDWPEVTTHELKCVPAAFQAIKDRAKTCEIRQDDRGFQVLDKLHLCEFDLEKQDYTGDALTVLVTHAVRGPAWGLSACTVAMSIRLVEEAQRAADV